MSKETDKILKGCFSPDRGKANLLEIKADPHAAEKHIRKAHQNLRAMRLMFSNDLFDWTVICGYYAMYHAVLASLFKIGIRATAHYCAIAAFKQFYIERDMVGAEYIQYIEKACKLERKYAESLDSAQQTRVTEQYGVEGFTNDDAEWIIEDSEEFVLKIEEVLAE